MKLIFLNRIVPYHESCRRHEETGREEESELIIFWRRRVGSRHELMNEFFESSGRHNAIFIVNLENRNVNKLAFSVSIIGGGAMN